ncbi:unnamed protein product [Peniophora sp. CBMAI 1063]|nr:unnamed protein product [Peniophora sp. CBMAI 1063]
MDDTLLDNFSDADVQQVIHDDIDKWLEEAGLHTDLSRYSNGEDLLQEAEVVKDDKRGYLAKTDGSGEEFIVSISGVLVEASIPPYRDVRGLFRSRPNKKDVPVNRVSIGWFGHASFEANRLGLENIRSAFVRKYDQVQGVPFPMKVGTPLITAENRIVSKVGDVPVEALDALLPKIQDPRDIIRNNLLSSNLYRYVDDNALTFERIEITDDEGGFTIVPCPPEEIKPGMIVSVQASPTVVPSTKAGHKMILKLRSILLVNDEVYTKFLFAKNAEDIESVPKPGAGLKRSASGPQWINPKRREMTVGDVEVRQGKKGKQPATPESVARDLAALKTSDKGLGGSNQ